MDLCNLNNSNYISISSKEAMKNAIHEIHNFLRNNGAGYGMNALKLFTLFYGLAKIEINGHFDKTGLNNICKFSNLVKSFKEDNIEFAFINVRNVAKEIYSEPKFKFMLGCVFPDAITPNTIKTLVEQINKLVLMESEMNFQLAGKIYEYFIGRDQTAISELGAYFTDRHITNYIYEKVHKPILDNNGNVKSMIDMFGGSGGFTLGYVSNLIKNYKNINWNEQLNNIYHMDMNLDVVKYTMLELYCLTGEFPERKNLMTINSFKDDFVNENGKMKFLNIYTNPPYGGDKINKSETVGHMELIKKKIEDFIKIKYYIKNFKDIYKNKEKLENKDINKLNQYEIITKNLKEIEKENKSKTVSLINSSKRFQMYAKENNIDGSKCKDKESVSFLMMMDLLEKNGTAVGVLKEGIFFDNKYAHLRKHCVENFNIEKIISIDSSQFENTNTKTSIIKFSNNGKTTKIKFYDMILEKEDKTDIIEKKDGTFDINTIKDRIIGVSDKLITEANYDDLVNNEFTFNYRKYNFKELKTNEGYKLVKLGDICEFNKINKISKSINGKYNYYTSSLAISKCDKFNFDGEYIVIGTKGTICTHYVNDKFSCSNNMEVLKSIGINTKYLYYILNRLSYSSTGSIIKTINQSDISNIKIPIPESKNKIKYWVDKINKPYNLIEESKKNLISYEEEIKNNIIEMLKNNLIEEIMLGNLFELKSGNFKSSDCKKIGKYPFFNGKGIQPSGYSDNFTIDKKIYIILIKDGGSGYKKYGKHIGLGNVYLVKNKSAFTCHQLALLNEKLSEIEFKYIHKFLDMKNDNLKDLAEYTTGLGTINRNKLNNFKIIFPKNRKLIEDLKPLFDKVDEIVSVIKTQESLYEKYLSELKNESIISDNNILLNLDDDLEKENYFSKSDKVPNKINNNFL